MDNISRYNTSFHAYTNGDILFDNSLIKSLKCLQKYAARNKRMLTVGQRSNYEVKKSERFVFTPFVIEVHVHNDINFLIPVQWLIVN